MLADHLTKLGFNLNEAKVYLALAESGKCTVGLLAKRSQLPRSTIYSTLELLAAKGVVAVQEDSNTKVFFALEPEAIVRMIQRQKEQSANAFKQSEALAQEVGEFLRPYFQTQLLNVPKLLFFEGEQNVENMLYLNTPIWRESMSQIDQTWWGFQDPSFVQQYRGWLNWVWESAREKEKVCLVSNPAEIEDKLKGKVKGRKIRFLKENIEIQSTIWICGEYIIMIMTQHKPHYAFQIKDALFAKNLRELLKLIYVAAR